MHTGKEGAYGQEDDDEAAKNNHGCNDRGNAVECGKKQNGEGQHERRYAVTHSKEGRRTQC